LSTVLLWVRIAALVWLGALLVVVLSEVRRVQRLIPDWLRNLARLFVMVGTVGVLTVAVLLGARMVSTIELPKRFGLQNGQRLIYSFLPKLPWSMGAFSEAQLRFICGHYPEDFAHACRLQINP